MEQTGITVSNGVVEGLLIRGLRLNEDPAACAALRSRGVDLSQLPRHLPLDRWNLAIEFAAQHTHPALSREAAMRQLGRTFIDGYLQTLSGALFAQILPLISPQRFCELFPIYLRTGRTDFEARVQSGPQSSRIHVREVSPLPEFMAGLVEAALARTKTEATVVVASRDEHSYQLAISW